MFKGFRVVKIMPRYFKLSHKHALKKTQISFVEFDDVVLEKLSVRGYYGTGNSKGRRLEYDFEYCLGCDLRLLDGAPILTRDILEDEFEKYVIQAKKGNFITSKEVTVQHSDFEVLERLIPKALALGKLKPG
jgi:hypothetical protein